MWSSWTARWRTRCATRSTPYDNVDAALRRRAATSTSRRSTPRRPRWWPTSRTGSRRRRSSTRSSSCRSSRAGSRWCRRRSASASRRSAGTSAYGVPSRARPALVRRARAPQRLAHASSTRCPNVDSVLVVLERTGAAPRHALRALVQGAFAHRRKALPKSLQLHGGDKALRDRARAALAELGLPEDARAERLTPAQFRALAERIGARDAPRDPRAGQDQRLPVPRPDARARRPPRAGVDHAVGDARRPPADRVGAGGRAPTTSSTAPASRAPTWSTTAIAAFRKATGWDGDPVRISIDKRLPVAAGMAGGSADAAAALRLLARASEIDDDELLHRHRRGARRRRPRAGPARARPGDRRGGARRARPGRRAATASWSCRVRRAAAHARRLPRGRPARAAARRPKGSPRRSTRCATALPDLPDELCVNELEPAALSLRPELEDTLARVRDAGADVAMVSGSGPTVLGLFHDRHAAKRARDEHFPGCKVAKPVGPHGGEVLARVKPGPLVAAVAPRRVPVLPPQQARADAADRRRDRRHRPARLRLRRRPAAGLQEDRRGRRRHARQLDLPRRRRHGVLRDRRVRRPDRARRDVPDLRRRRRGAGDDQPRRPDRDHVDVRGARRPRVVLRAGAGSAASSWSSTGRRSQITEERIQPGRGLLRPPRRQGDLPRPLRRARARGQPVPGRARPGCRSGASCPTTSSARARWATMLLVLGYIFWQSFDKVLHYAEQGTLALGTVIVVLAAAIWAYRHFRVEENREAAARWIDTQLDRPVAAAAGSTSSTRSARWLRGPLVFFWNRITPGDLGLELTTQLAVAAVGSFAYAANAIGLRDRTRHARRRDRVPLGRRHPRRHARRRRAGRSRTSGRCRGGDRATVITVVVLLTRAADHRVARARERAAHHLGRRARRQGRGRPAAAAATRSSRPPGSAIRRRTPRTRSRGSRSPSC